MYFEDEIEEICFSGEPLQSSSDWERIESVVFGKEVVIAFKLHCKSNDSLSSFFSDSLKGKVELLLSVSKTTTEKATDVLHYVEVIENELTYWLKACDTFEEAVEFCNKLLDKANKEPVGVLELSEEDFDQKTILDEDVSAYYNLS